MKKIILIGLLSLGLVACEDSGSDASGSAVYGLDFEYDGSHPEEISLNENGHLEPFLINAIDVVEECGKTFYKSFATNDIFYAVEYEGSWYAQQVGGYYEYNKSVGGYQVISYEKRQMVSVGKFVVISQHSGLTQYFDWTRINYQHIPSHDNCMVIIDEVNQDVLSVDLSNDTTQSIF